MTAHDRAIELGAVGFDFPLTRAERDDLAGHLATCARCRAELEGMADDARRLAARRVPRLSPSRSEAIRRSIERPGRGLHPAMLLAAAMLLLLATWVSATVGAELLRRLDDRLAVVPLPSSTVPTAEDTPLPVAWQMTPLGRAADPIPFDPVAVARTGTGWIAIGTRSCVPAATQDVPDAFDCAIPIASSTTGDAWASTGGIALGRGWIPPTSGPDIGALDAAVGPDGLVVVGFDLASDAIGHDGVPRAATNGTAWWSSDGLTWEAQRLGDGARPAAAFRGRDRWLIGGVRYGDTGPTGAIWTSTDGRSWSLVEDDALLDVGGYVDTMEDPASGGIRAFAALDDVIVAGGQVCARAGLPCKAAAWVSEDGVSWSRAETLPAGDAVTDVAVVNGALVATARTCPARGDCATTLMRSIDGRSWQAVSGPAGMNAAMAVGDGTLVLATGGHRSLDVLATTNGLEWHPLGTVTAPAQANWSPPVLVARTGGLVDLLIRIDPVDDAGSEADAWTAIWGIAPAP